MLWTPAFFRAPEQNYENQTAQKALALHVYSHFSITQDNEGRRGQKSLKYWQYWDSKGLVDTNTDNEASACHSTETGSKSSARPEQAPAFVHVPPRLCKWLVLPKKFKWISYFYFSDVSVQVPRGWAMAGTSSSSWAARAAPSLSWAQKPHRNPSWEVGKPGNSLKGTRPSSVRMTGLFSHLRTRVRTHQLHRHMFSPFYL